MANGSAGNSLKTNAFKGEHENCTKMTNELMVLARSVGMTDAEIEDAARRGVAMAVCGHPDWSKRVSQKELSRAIEKDLRTSN